MEYFKPDLGYEREFLAKPSDGHQQGDVGTPVDTQDWIINSTLSELDVSEQSRFLSISVS